MLVDSYFRHRELEVADLPGSVQWEYDGVPFGAPVPQIIASQVKTIDDWVTPGYRQLIKAGYIINSPCTLFDSVMKSGEGGHYIGTRDSDGRVDELVGDSQTLWISNHVGPNIAGTLSTEISSQSASEEAAMFQALTNLDSTPYKMGEDVFEIRETLRFLRNPLASLSKLSKSFNKDVRKHWTFKSNPANSMADVWLQYRFAASPLVRSVYDLAEAAASIGKEELPPRKNARGKSEINISETKEVKGGAWSNTMKHTSAKSDIVRAQILYEVSNPIQSVSTTLGLRAKDIPEVIWAVMPYSFMIDRLINVSGTIAAYTNLLDPNVKILSSSVTRRTKTRSIVKVIDEDTDGWSFDIDGDEYTVDEFTYKRDRWFPTLSDATAPITLGGLTDDITKTTDLIALVLNGWQKFS